MKTATLYPTNMNRKPYPNAATRREVINKVLDTLLVGAIGAGAAASLLFMLLLF